MEIEIVRDRIEPERLNTLVSDGFGDMVKFVVDLQRKMVAVGGSMHADAEAALIEAGSEQEDLWGANYFPDNDPGQRIVYESLINIRPRANNRSMMISDETIRSAIRQIVEQRIGDA